MATAAAQQSDRLAQVLVQEGLLTREQLVQAQTEQRASKCRLPYSVV
jgi:hypothetical protein